MKEDPTLSFHIIDFPCCGRNWIPEDKGYILVSSQNCDMCGSHSIVELNVTCKCGKSHEITLYDS